MIYQAPRSNFSGEQGETASTESHFSLSHAPGQYMLPENRDGYRIVGGIR